MSPPINSAVPGWRRGASPPDRQVRVPLGIVVVTRSVDRQLLGNEDGRTFVMSCLRRHVQGDWGDLGPHDAEANDLALVTGARVLSSYPIPQQLRGGGETPAGGSSGGSAGPDPQAGIGDDRVWVITESEDAGGSRPQTTVLFPSDY